MQPKITPKMGEKLIALKFTRFQDFSGHPLRIVLRLQFPVVLPPPILAASTALIVRCVEEVQWRAEYRAPILTHDAITRSPASHVFHHPHTHTRPETCAQTFARKPFHHHPLSPPPLSTQTHPRASPCSRGENTRRHMHPPTQHLFISPATHLTTQPSLHPAIISLTEFITHIHCTRHKRAHLPFYVLCFW